MLQKYACNYQLQEKKQQNSSSKIQKFNPNPLHFPGRANYINAFEVSLEDRKKPQN